MNFESLSRKGNSYLILKVFVSIVKQSKYEINY